MNEDKIIQKLIEHDEQLIEIQEKLKDIPSRDELFGKFDQVLTILDRLDQERIFTVEWIKRLETQVKENTSDIQHLKQHLKVA